MDKEDINLLEGEIARLSELLQGLKEKYPEEEILPTELHEKSLINDPSSPWIPFFEGSAIPVAAFTLKNIGKSSVVLEAKASLMKSINAKIPLSTTSKTTTIAVVIKHPFFGAMLGWKAKQSKKGHRALQPRPLPVDSYDDGGHDWTAPWVMCKVSIRKGSYVRFHLSKAWSEIVKEHAGHLFEKVFYPLPKTWALVNDLDKTTLNLPSRVTYAWEGDSLRINLPSWWKYAYERYIDSFPALLIQHDCDIDGHANRIVKGRLLGVTKGENHVYSSRKSAFYKYMKRNRKPSLKTRDGKTIQALDATRRELDVIDILMSFDFRH